MSAFRSTLCLAALPLAALITVAPASAQTKDHAPVALKSSAKMTQDKANSESWTYVQPREVFTKYRGVIVDPTAVYQGADAQFDGIDSADRYKAASVVTEALRNELAKTFPSPATPQADTLRLKVTILGATKTKGGIATATRVTPIGFGLSAVKSALGKPGTFTGSVLFAVELYDAKTNELLLAAVRRRTPDPLDVPATISQEETIKAVAREFADGARKRLENLTGVVAQ
ncbi:DUF3313 domain-containing protein [Sphingomonas alba]|uniref:DUF3313 domain-containing protein n=1 Tax=Sphingomonas alba TaxID=2908208 RepID=A0ABT0RNN2_9SPHN|nr:DUF3313 domain-containing protein [Sphingomonas alba]MCL6684178.1 DUF3313 domain-containing protein [Sphingomonas alba]